MFHLKQARFRLTHPKKRNKKNDDSEGESHARRAKFGQFDAVDTVSILAILYKHNGKAYDNAKVDTFEASNIEFRGQLSHTKKISRAQLNRQPPYLLHFSRYMQTCASFLPLGLKVHFLDSQV